ncbi:hypothetical protein QW060_26675 [Myroides ceti]|uniref:Uncharacterized protein n=1 Tax=Paenimyroides ceti TaxID=395087 RepID=A0ABT8D4U7_9FLAO|nr:hypothetical protein [Paenimyroides ceti]MDN3710407.1 hypothetical protein [Paenimyroides ceti]
MPTSGNFEQQVGNEIKKVSENQALFVMQGEVTSLLRQSRNVKGFYILFEDKILQQFKDHGSFIKLFTTAPIIQLQKNESEFLELTCKLIIRELEAPECDEQIVLHLFQSLLLKFLNHQNSEKDSQDNLISLFCSESWCINIFRLITASMTMQACCIFPPTI